MTSLPHRFREDSFRRYEAAITSIVAAFPYSVSFNPSPLSPVTFSCRLRDAMKSLARYRWPSSVHMDKFDAIHSAIVVSEQDGKIVCGSREHIRQPSAPVLTDAAPMADDPFDLEVNSDSELNLLGLLAHNRVLSRPIRFTGALASLPSVDWLTSHFDVTAHFDEASGSVTIL